MNTRPLAWTSNGRAETVLPNRSLQPAGISLRPSPMVEFIR